MGLAETELREMVNTTDRETYIRLAEATAARLGVEVDFEYDCLGEYLAQAGLLSQSEADWLDDA
jgi:hypothetical protein